MATLIFIWIGVCISLLIVGSGQRPSAGLPLAYFLGLSLIHTPGALLYLNTTLQSSNADLTTVGFEQTAIGMVAFAVGVAIARLTSSSLKRDDEVTVSFVDLPAIDKMALIYLGCGFLSFAAMQFIGRIPSVGAVIAALVSLMIVGVSLRLWVAEKMGDAAKWWKTAALIPLFPVLTLLKDGFLGFGTYWMLAIICFATNQSTRSKARYYLLLPFVAYLGLSVFVNYMASRTEFRQLVWVQQVGLGDRISRFVDMFENFKFVDFSDQRHVDAIDGRLNQNLLVGLAVERLQSGLVQFASGSTINQTIIGLIPRALWPDKPQVGGGGSIVSQFTGMEFAEGTSVGAGQVLEFYVNFGTLGVIGGFLVYGWIIGRIDLRIMAGLYRNDQKSFVLWYLIGLSMLQPGGNLLEIVVTAASSAVAATGLGFVIDRIFRKYRFGDLARSEIRAS